MAVTIYGDSMSVMTGTIMSIQLLVLRIEWSSHDRRFFRSFVYRRSMFFRSIRPSTFSLPSVLS